MVAPWISIPLFEPQQRAHSPWLAAGLASESKIDRIPYGRRFLAACCEESSIAWPGTIEKRWQLNDIPAFPPSRRHLQGRECHRRFDQIKYWLLQEIHRHLPIESTEAVFWVKRRTGNRHPLLRWECLSEFDPVTAVKKVKAEGISGKGRQF